METTQTTTTDTTTTTTDTTAKRPRSITTAGCTKTNSLVDNAVRQGAGDRALFVASGLVD